MGVHTTGGPYAISFCSQGCGALGARNIGTSNHDSRNARIRGVVYHLVQIRLKGFMGQVRTYVKKMTQKDVLSRWVIDCPLKSYSLDSDSIEA